MQVCVQQIIIISLSFICTIVEEEYNQVDATEAAVQHLCTYIILCLLHHSYRYIILLYNIIRNCTGKSIYKHAYVYNTHVHIRIIQGRRKTFQGNLNYNKSIGYTTPITCRLCICTGQLLCSRKRLSKNITTTDRPTTEIKI